LFKGLDQVHGFLQKDLAGVLIGCGHQQNLASGLRYPGAPVAGAPKIQPVEDRKAFDYDTSEAR
jgi:hypothetical protein